MLRFLRLPLRERPQTLRLLRHDDCVSLARRLGNMVVRCVVAILFAIGGVVVLSVLLDALAKI